jgi:hypothetical protein
LGAAFSSRFYSKIFERTLLEKFQPPPQPLLEIRELIKRSLFKNFLADFDCEKLTGCAFSSWCDALRAKRLTGTRRTLMRSIEELRSSKTFSLLMSRV